MGKYSFLKQWFTFTFNDDNKTDLIFSCSNNHYIHTWLEKHGYTSFENIISPKDLDLFLQALNESINKFDFDIYFPEEYIEDYSLWNMDIGHYWSGVEDYREHAKKQMEILFNKIYDISQDEINGPTKGVLNYHIYYNC